MPKANIEENLAASWLYGEDFRETLARESWLQPNRLFRIHISGKRNAEDMCRTKLFTWLEAKDDLGEICKQIIDEALQMIDDLGHKVEL